MNYDVIEAEYVSDFIVKLRFRDGTVGEIDLQPELTGPIFEPLKNPEYSENPGELGKIFTENQRTKKY